MVRRIWILAMDRIRQPFNVSRPAEAAAVAALSDDPFLVQSLAHVERWRPRLRQMPSLGGL